MLPDDSHENLGRLPTRLTTLETTRGGRVNNNGPSLDNATYMLVLLVVLIPIVFTVLLCAITYCIYRHNRRRTDRIPTNSPIVPTDRSGAPLSTVIYNTQHSPYVYEDSPPSYDSLSNMKKDFSGTMTTTTTNTGERVQLATLPSIGLTSAGPIIRPSAPTPPPSYTNLQQLHP